MKYKLEALAVCACGLAIAVGIIYSIGMLFVASPAFGIAGCVVFVSSCIGANKVFGR
jgi:hypothetical protein